MHPRMVTHPLHHVFTPTIQPPCQYTTKTHTLPFIDERELSRPSPIPNPSFEISHATNFLNQTYTLTTLSKTLDQINYQTILFQYKKIKNKTHAHTHLQHLCAHKHDSRMALQLLG